MMKSLFSLCVLTMLCLSQGTLPAKANEPTPLSDTEMSGTELAARYEVWYRANAKQRWRSYGYGLSLYDAANAVRDLRRKGYQAYYERL